MLLIPYFVSGLKHNKVSWKKTLLFHKSIVNYNKRIVREEKSHGYFRH